MLHALLVASVAAAGVALLLLLANLAAIPRLSRAGSGPERTPRVSVVIPARNEEREIENAVRSHLSQRYPDFEVVVVDDRSRDATGGILARLAREDPRLTVVAGKEPPAGWLGKPHALAQGAAAATGELLLFADADVRYHPLALSEAVTFFQGRRLDFLLLLPRFQARGFWENVLMPYVPGAFFLGPGFLASRPRPRWIAAGGGAGSLVRRSAYESVGGHAGLPNSVIDDIRLAYLVKRAGCRMGVARAEDRVAVRMYRGLREIWDGFTKNIAYLFFGPGGFLLLALTSLALLLAILPVAVLAAALVGAPAAPRDLELAAAGYALPVLSRLLLASALGDPLWPAATHPIMAAVWAGILSRSLFHRFVRRRLAWRGRDFDSRAVRL